MISLTNSTPKVLVPSVAHSELQASSISVIIGCLHDCNAALPYTEYPLRMLKFEIRAEITEYDANGRGGACTKRYLCESVKNACGSLQIS